MDNAHSKKIVTSVYVSLYSTLAVIVFIGVLFFASLYAQKWIVHTNEVKAQILDISETLTKAESIQRAYIITKDNDHRIDYKVAVKQLFPKIEELRIKAYDNQVQRDYVDSLALKVRARVEIMDDNMMNYILGSPEENRSYKNRDQNLQLIAEINDLRDIMLLEENRLLEDRKSYYDSIYVLSLVILAVGIMIILYSLFMLRKRLLPLFDRLEESNDILSDMVSSREEEIKLKEQQMEINEDLIHQLEDKNKQLNQFAYIASHDLQEPLRTVDNFIDIFEEEYRETLDEEASQYFGFIKGATARMKNLITGLLNYSRLGRSGVKAEVYLNDLIENIKNDLNTRIEERGVIITNDKLPVIHGYPVELRQLFVNLITNAIKFTPPERSPVIHIGYQKLKGYHEFKIKDNGLGIKKEHIDKIFSMFTRLHSTKDYEGTGIGLAFCQKIVELHRGKISVESTLGEGSTFRFLLKRDRENETN